MSFYTIAKNIVAFFIPLFYRIKYEGIENIPKNEGYILCSNHISNMDPIFLAVKIKNQCHFMSKQELFKIPVLSYFLRILGAFPVNRGKGDTKAVEHAISIVKDNKILAIFPEGTRSKNGELLKLKSGVFVIASRTGGDLLPCVIKKGNKGFLRRKITVKYGKLIPNSELGTSEMLPSELKNANRMLSKTFSDMLEEIND